MGVAGEGVIPPLRTTAQQANSYAPYVEMVPSGQDGIKITWRVVNTNDTSKARAFDFKTKVQLRVLDIHGDWSEELVDWETFKAGELVRGEEPLEVSVPIADVKYIIVKLNEFVPFKGGTFRHYRWLFFPRTQSDEGVNTWGDFESKSITLKEGETKDLSLTLKEGYFAFGPSNRACDREPGYIVGNNTILGVVNSSKENKVALTLKGLKPGKTTLSVRYCAVYESYDDTVVKRFNTLPIKVTVTGTGGDVPSGSGGGGGCNAGFAGLTALAPLTLGALLLLKRKN